MSDGGTGVGADSAPEEPGGGWAAELARELASAADHDGELLTPRLQAELLHLARDVAHSVERKNAPLAAFLAGRYVELRRAAGVDPEAALAEVVGMASQRVTDAPATP